MNIQMPSHQLGVNSPNFAGHGFQQMQKMQMMMSLLANIMQMFSGGAAGNLGGLSRGNPSFGCNCCQGSQHGLPGSNYNQGQMPGFDQFTGANPSHSYPNTGNLNTGSIPRSRDTYVPQGNDQIGQLGDLGSGTGSDAVRWAMQHEGISESNNPNAVRAISRGAWQPWCADFVSQAYANSPGGSPFGHQSSVQGILNWGRNNDRFFDTASAMRNPSALRVGDVAVWKSDGRSHVGLVTGLNPDGTFNTIEGNTSDAVRRRTHSFMGRGLTGFVRPRG